MTEHTLFRAFDSEAMVALIAEAQKGICYAAPGIRTDVAKALVAFAEREPDLITVHLDFDERVIRMGYGDLDAVELLRKAGISVNSSPGLRTGLIIVDDQGYIFTPTALFLEAESHVKTALNAMRLSTAQVQEALARMTPAARELACVMAKTDEERERIKKQAAEFPTAEIAEQEVEQVRSRLADAPPMKFDVARQVRVYNAYLQYVDLKLSGAAIQRNRVEIPKSIQRLGADSEIESRLKTTFDLIEIDGKLSSRNLDAELNKIRDDLTPSLGKKYGRAVLVRVKPLLEKRVAELRAKLAEHQKLIKSDLQKKLDQSLEQVAAYFMPSVRDNPPDNLFGRFGDASDKSALEWLRWELASAFPKAESLIGKMSLEVQYKDVTFETLNDDGFNKAVENAFKGVDWSAPYSEFKAAGEHQKQDSGIK